MRRFENKDAPNLSGAISLLQEENTRGRYAAVAGGGTDLLVLIKEDITAPDTLVNLKTLEGLNEITEDKKSIRIGGLITLSELSQHPLIRSRYTVLSEAAETVATPQIRNVGTLSGNLCQRPWCWYFRRGFPCLKNGGNRCYSVTGENQFNAIFAGGPSYIVHPSDTAPALLSLGAFFHIIGPNGSKSVPANEFFLRPRQDVTRETILESNEILSEIEIPIPSPRLKSTYNKFMDRQAWTHAVGSVAAALEIDENNVCHRASLALGGVAPIPWQLPRVEQLLAGKPLTNDLAVLAGKAAVAGARPLSENAYKVSLTETLVRRTLLSLTK